MADRFEFRSLFEFHGLETITITEGRFPDTCYTGWDRDFLCFVGCKRTHADAVKLDSRLKGDGLKTGFRKCVISNGCHTGRNRDLRKIITVFKCVFLDGCNTIWNHDFVKGKIEFKSVDTDALKLAFWCEVVFCSE